MDYNKASREIPPELPPWDVLKLWVADEIYQQYSREQIIRRITVGPIPGDYDLEFTWPNSFLYDGDTYNVMAHLHVRGDVAQNNGGGIWVTGLRDTGLNWGNLQGRTYLFEYMSHYVE